MEALPQNPIDALMPHIHTAFENWFKENSPEQTQKRVYRELDNHKKEILLKLLGFNTSWGSQWELDHCNGRAGNSTAGDYLRQVMDQSIKDFLSEVTMPTLTATDKESIMSSCKSEYMQALKRNVSAAIAQTAKRDAEQLVQAICQPRGAESYLELLKLVTKD